MYYMRYSVTDCLSLVHVKFQLAVSSWITSLNQSVISGGQSQCQWRYYTLYFESMFVLLMRILLTS